MCKTIQRMLKEKTKTKNKQTNKERTRTVFLESQIGQNNCAAVVTKMV